MSAKRGLSNSLISQEFRKHPDLFLRFYNNRHGVVAWLACINIAVAAQRKQAPVRDRPFVPDDIMVTILKFLPLNTKREMQWQQLAFLASGYDHGPAMWKTPSMQMYALSGVLRVINGRHETYIRAKTEVLVDLQLQPSGPKCKKALWWGRVWNDKSLRQRQLSDYMLKAVQMTYLMHGSVDAVCYGINFQNLHPNWRRRVIKQFEAEAHKQSTILQYVTDKFPNQWLEDN